MAPLNTNQHSRGYSTVHELAKLFCNPYDEQPEFEDKYFKGVMGGGGGNVCGKKNEAVAVANVLYVTTLHFVITCPFVAPF